MCTHAQNRKSLRTLVPFEQIHSAVQGLAMRTDEVAAGTPAVGASAGAGTAGLVGARGGDFLRVASGDGYG